MMPPVPVAEEKAHLLTVWVQPALEEDKKNVCALSNKASRLAVQLRDSLKMGVYREPIVIDTCSEHDSGGASCKCEGCSGGAVEED